MGVNKEIQSIAEEFQNECHKVIDTLIKNDSFKNNKDVIYQDLANTWTFHKLAELEFRLRRLESNEKSNIKKSDIKIPEWIISHNKSV